EAVQTAGMIPLVKAFRPQEQMKVAKSALRFDGFVVRRRQGCQERGYCAVSGGLGSGISRRRRPGVPLSTVDWQCGPQGQRSLPRLVRGFTRSLGPRALAPAPKADKA